MYKYLFPLFIMCSVSTFAQKGFFIKPNIGSGITSTRMLTTTPRKIHGTTAGIQLGYSFSRLRLGIGAAILNTGFCLKNLAFESGYNPQTGTATETFDYTTRFNDLLIPISVGFTIPTRGKLAIIPEVSFAPSFTLRNTSKFEYQPSGDITRNTTTHIANRFTTFGIASVNLVYNITPHIGIFLSPTYYRSFNNVLKARPGFTMYAITANAGVIWKL